MALRRKYCGPAPGAGDQALLDAVLDSTADGILVVGLDGRILAFNQRFVELWRIPPDMVRGTEDAELLAFVIGQLTDPDGFLTRVKALYSNSSMESLDILMFKDGRVFERFSQALNVGKAHAGRVWSFRDITRQVLAEEARKASEEFYRAIVESAEEGIWLIDMSGATLFGNRKMSEMLGIDNDRLTGCRVQEFVDREGASILERAIERRKRGMHERYELRLFRPDGSSFWALVSGCPLYDSQRRFIGSFAMVTDITDRKVMEDGLHADVEERANFLQSIVENIPDMIFVKDAGTLRFVQFNQAGEKLLGYSREEMIGKSDFDFFPKEEAEKFVAKDREVLSAGKVADIPEETVHTRHKGSRTLHTKKIPIHDSSGKPAFLLGISEDITLQKRMEEEQRRRLDAEVARKRADLLADLSKRLAATLEPREVVARLARILSTDLAEWSAVAVRDRNGALRVMTAADLGECTLDLGAPEGIPRVLRTGKPVLYQRLGRSSLHRFGFRDPTRLKRLACLEATTGMAVPIFCQSGVRGAILLLARDRPPYEEAELAFAQEVADRAALAFENAWLYQQAQSAIRLRDEFISIASHELRTPLTPLTAQLTLIHRMLEQSGKSVLSDEKLRKLVRLSEHDLGRLTRLVENLLDVSKIGASRLTLNREEVDLSQEVEDTVSKFRGPAEEAGARIELRVERGLTGFWDRMRLEQVIRNLMSNAVKFGQGKPIEVSLSSKGDRVLLEVRDHGMGIPPAERDRIFHRFERAKSGRQFVGLGLGLYISRQIVKAHGGTIRAESPGDQEGGTCFVIELPRSQSRRMAA